MKLSEHWLQRWATRWRLPKGRRARALAACMSLGLATAWTTCWTGASEAATVHLEVAPTQPITHAYVGYYHKNSSSVTTIFLGDLAGGQLSVFDHDFPGVPESAFEPEPESLLGPSYLLIGLYGEPGAESVVLSFPNSSPIDNGETWESLVQPLRGRTEAAVVAGLLDPQLFSVGAFFSGHRELLGTRYGDQATLIHFSEAGFGGTALAQVPEPGTAVLLVTGAGLFVLTAGRRVIRCRA